MTYKSVKQLFLGKTTLVIVFYISFISGYFISRNANIDFSALDNALMAIIIALVTMLGFIFIMRIILFMAYPKYAYQDLKNKIIPEILNTRRKW